MRERNVKKTAYLLLTSEIPAEVAAAGIRVIKDHN